MTDNETPATTDAPPEVETPDAETPNTAPSAPDILAYDDTEYIRRSSLEIAAASFRTDAGTRAITERAEAFYEWLTTKPDQDAE